MNLAFGCSNQGVYAIGARSGPTRSRLWCIVTSVSLQPHLNLVVVKPHESAEFQVWDHAVFRPDVQRRGLHLQPLRHFCDGQQGHIG